jgi:tetratricopeptide (TPR) repeat protein
VERPPWPEPLGACLGAGGFAAVWELPGDRVLKVAHAGHELARARVAREAEALAAIGAPAVPRLDATGVLADGRAWLAMARIAGRTLGELVAAGPLDMAEVIALAIGLCDAVERIHAARFVHRDLKPDNAVRAGDHVVVLDLGLARKLPADPDDPTRAHVQVGSLEYLPPEQAGDAAAVDERADLYALGCVLYELVAGRPPFVGDAAALERAHAALRPPRLGALASVPAGIEALVMDCLAKDPARRPESAAAVRARVIEARDEPSARPHTVSMIREGKQPVVLLWAELPKVDRALLGMLAARRVVIASQRGRRVLAGVAGGEHADPAAVAIAAARDLAAAGARVALHLEALRVETATGATTLHGQAIEHPESWLPADTWTGVVLSRALASVTQVPTRALESGFHALAGDAESVDLVGRDALLTDLAADAAAALALVPEPERESSITRGRGSGPAFALLVGEAGVGKTAFANELARRLGELGVHVRLESIPAPGTGKRALELAVEPTVGAIGDALRAGARGRPTALILDDLHLADHDLLDALEYATLGGEPLPLWVLGVASPRLDVRRPQLGSRAERRRRDVLPPLEEDAAVALAAALLRPAEYPPLRVLRRLAAIAHGNPLHLAMLARALHERGAIRERPGGAPFLDTTALDELQPAALAPWLAARELAPLSAELVALARLCAVLGGEVSRDELVAILEAVERRGGATTTIDVDVGLRELARAGLLVERERGHAFCQSLVEEGVYATTDERERHALHEAALEHWRGRDAERVAHHAEAIGARAVAAAAFAELGTRAEHDQRVGDAELAWQRAIDQLDARDAAYVRALVGRARARYKLQRIRDALADLEVALAIARELADAALEVRVLVEQATALDWGDDHERSAAAAQQARARLPADAELALEVELAEARTLFRRQEFAPAAAALAGVLERAGSRTEIAVVAGLLLGPSLVGAGELAAAERAFADVIALCERTADRAHLGFAYANRAWLWEARGAVDRSRADLRHVIQLARELGQAAVERTGTHNLAESLLWTGELDEALRLARRCLVIQQGHAEGSTHADRQLLARVLAARGDRDELTQVVATFDPVDAIRDEDTLVTAALRAVLGGDWRPVVAAIDLAFVQLRLEVAQLAAREGQLTEPTRTHLVELARADPIWSRRAHEL